jgi:hypothetical protein
MVSPGWNAAKSLHEIAITGLPSIAFASGFASVGASGFCWRPAEENSGCKPSSGNDNGDQARAKQDKTGNSHGKEAVRSYFFTHGTPPGRWLPSRLSRLLE